MTWTAQVNDLVGGWCVTNYPYPLSDHDFRKDGDPAKKGYVMADDFYCREDAEVVARLLNGAGITRDHEGSDVR